MRIGSKIFGTNESEFMRIFKICFVFFITLFPILLFYQIPLLIHPSRFGSQTDLSHIYARSVLEGKSEAAQHKQVIVLGDSASSTAIHPEIATNTLNLSMWAASYLESEQVLTKYLENVGKPQCVIIMNSYIPSMYWGDWFPNYVAHNNWWSLSELFNMWVSHEESWFRGSLRFLKNLPERFRLESSYLKFFQYGIWNENRYSALSKIFDTKFGSFIVEAEKGTFGENFRPWHLLLEKPFSQDKNFDKSLNRILSRLEKEEVPSFLVNFPISNSLEVESIQKHIQQRNAHLKKIGTYYSKNKFININSFLPAEYFHDNLHLNPSGALLFTKNLSESGVCL